MRRIPEILHAIWIAYSLNAIDFTFAMWADLKAIVK